MAMTKRELINALLEGPMDDEVKVVNVNESDDDSVVGLAITGVADVNDDGECFIYFEDNE